MKNIKSIIDFAKIKKNIKNIDKNYYILIGIAILLLFPLFSYFYVNGHDTYFHYSNVSVIKEYIRNGNYFPTAILPDIANGFGYGIGIFYPRLAHFSCAYLSVLLDIEIITAFKIFQFIVVSLSGFFMYKFVFKTTKNKISALIAATFYMTSPYFMSDFYTRSALSESLIFLFTPIIFLGLYELFETNNIFKFYLLFSIGFIGTIYSHIITGMFLFAIVCIYLLFNIKKLIVNKRILHLILSSLIIIVYSLPFLIPLIEHKMFGNYAIFLEGYMGNPDWAYGTALNFSDYVSITFNVKNNGIAFYFNIVMIIMFIMSIVKRREISKKIKNTYPFIILSIFITIFATKFIPWNKFPDFMHMIQFPWRLEIFIAFFVSIVSSYLVLTWNKNKLETFVPIIIIFSIFLALNSINYSNINYFNVDADKSILGMGSQKEYLPTNTLNNYSYLENRTNKTTIINGNADIEEEKLYFPSLKVNVKNIENNFVTLEIPRLYYLGYKIKLINDDKIINLKYRENLNGFIEFDVFQDCDIYITYEGTKLWKASIICAYVVSIIIVILFTIYIVNKFKFRSKIIY